MRYAQRRVVGLAFGIALPGLVGCSEEPKASAPTAEHPSAAASAAGPALPARLARAEFTVEGMTCGGCAIGTRAALKKLDGVRDAGASYENSRAWALYDPVRVNPERMMAAIRELGYTPTLERAES